MDGIAINSHIALNLQYKTYLNICCVVEQNITVVWLSKVNPQKVCTSQFMLIQENTSWKIFQTNFKIVLCFTTFRHFVNKDMFCSVQLYIYVFIRGPHGRLVCN